MNDKFVAPVMAHWERNYRCMPQRQLFFASFQLCTPVEVSSALWRNWPKSG